VADAQNTLDNLKSGADALALKADQLALQSALIDLEEASNNLAHAQVTAPIRGTVLAVSAEVGQRANQGAVVVTLADPTLLKLTIDVAEVDISQIRANQPVQIAIDAFPGRIFEGKVAYVAPTSSSTSGLIEYPVTVLLTDKNLADVRPGMTAVATISSTNTSVVNGWFVPTNAIIQQGSDKVVIVVRNKVNVPVKVTPGTIQGEWTVVQTPDLKNGDEVAGSVTTKINNNQSGFGPGRGPPPPGAP
jgi:membrane fusion protein (multidrug efflux system)